MVDLPSIANRIPEVHAPQSRVSPGQVAQPYGELAANLDKAGEVLSKDFAEPLAKKAGFDAVTRDAEGNLQVEKAPIVGDAATAFRRAAQFSALHQGEAEAKRKDLVLSKEFHNDPEGYLKAAQTFRDQHVAQFQKAIGPEVAASLGRSIDNYTTNNYRSLVLEQQRNIKQNFDRDTTAAIKSLDEDIFSLVESGDMGSPTLTSKINERIRLTHERVNNPVLSASPGVAALDLKNFDEKVGAAKFTAAINNILKTKGVDAAMSAVNQTSVDSSISPNQRVLNAAYGQKAIKDHLQNMERMIVLENKQRKQADQSAEDLVIQDTASGDPKITENDIKTSNMSPEAKMRMLAWKKRDGMPEPLARTSQTNAMDLFSRMNLPDDDPGRITDLRPIRDAYVNGKLSRQDEEWLEKRFLEARSPEGERLTKIRTEFNKGVEQSIDKSNPLMGKLDQSGKLQFYSFQRFIDQKVDQYRAEKKNPYDLFDPTKPDFLGRPEILQQFQVPFEQSIKNIGEKFKPRPALPQPAQTVLPAEQPTQQPSSARKPNESPEDYLKRIGGAQ